MQLEPPGRERDGRKLSFAHTAANGTPSGSVKPGTPSGSSKPGTPSMDINGRPLSRGLSAWAVYAVEMPKTIKYLEDYDEKDFALPDEELPDGRLTYHEQCVLASQRYRIKYAAREVKQASKLTATIDGLYRESLISVDKERKERLNCNGASTNTLGRKGYKQESQIRAVKEHEAEMALLRSIVGRDPCSAHRLSKMTPEDFGDESTLDYPKLDSLEEAQEDLRLEALESYYNSRGGKGNVKWSCSDRRKLRNWFKALDYDHSGEVSVAELTDPLLSAGILKTRDQVYRVLLNADKNGTMGLDFKEFLDALHGNALAKSDQLLELQNIGSDTTGLSMETMITAERRKKLINSVVDQTEKRGYFFDKQFKTLAQAFTSGRGVFTRANKRLGQIEDQHEYERLLHNKYIDSLEHVVKTKKLALVNEENAELDKNVALRNVQNSQLYQGPSTVGNQALYSRNINNPTPIWDSIEEQRLNRKKNIGINLAGNPYACYNPSVDQWARRSKSSTLSDARVLPEKRKINSTTSLQI